MHKTWVNTPSSYINSHKGIVALHHVFIKYTLHFSRRLNKTAIDRHANSGDIRHHRDSRLEQNSQDKRREVVKNIPNEDAGR
jgi:hypothetical protein